jgi:[ribosomal protein S18]-alanine N-acetyltransferase
MIDLLSKLFRRAEPSLLDARADDAAALSALHARAFRHGWSEGEFERLLADRNVICHVARSDRGALVGFVISRVVEDEAEILMVAVAPGERGRGLARRLLNRHLGRLAARAAHRVFLEVDEGNDAALRLYSRAGFQQVGRRPGYYVQADGNAAALLLRRELR